MPSVARHNYSFSRTIIPASVIVSTIASPSWSAERNAVHAYEGIAKFHYQSRPSLHADGDHDGEFEFTALPLVKSRVVQMKFRHIGQLPPMRMQDEIIEDA